MTEQNNTTNSLAHTKWNCKYHIVFAPKYRRKVFYAEKRETILYKGIMPSEKVLDLPVDCNTLTGSVNL